MMPTETTVPAVPAPASVPAGDPQVAVQTPVARSDDNLSGAALAAAFTRARQARTSRTAPAAPPATSQPPAPEPAAPPAPAAEAAPANDNSNAASTPEPAPAEETPPPAPAEPEATPTAEPAAPEAEPAEAGDKIPIPERINKLTARLKKTERELDEAREQLETLQQTPLAKPAPPGPELFAADPEVRSLTQTITDLRTEESWLRQNPDGGEITNAEGKVVFSITAEQARARVTALQDQLDDLRAAKAVRVRELDRSHKETAAKAEQVLATRFPWAAEARNEQAELLRSIEQRVPEINRIPGWKLLAAYGLEALKAEQTKAKAPAKPAPAPPRVAVPAGAPAPRVNASARKLAEAEAAYEKSGRASDFKRVLELRREARLAPA